MHKINNIYILLRNKVQIVNKYTIKSIFHVLFSFKHICLVTMTFGMTTACNNWVSENDEVIARVGSEYLYRDDLMNRFENFENKTDSLLKTRTFIDTWARDKILLQQAQLNLEETKIEQLDQLIDQYRLDLYANAYRKTVVLKNIDTLVRNSEIDSFLFENKNVFKLNAPLYQVRYIHLPPENVDQREIERSFQRFNPEDQFFLDSLSFQFYSYRLSDSLWINRNTLLTQVGFLNQGNYSKYIKKSQFFKIEDTLGVYLFFVKNFLEKGSITPREVISPTIKNILINQRKLKFSKQFEKDILRDAIKSKNYETY